MLNKKDKIYLIETVLNNLDESFLDSVKSGVSKITDSGRYALDSVKDLITGIKIKSDLKSDLEYFPKVGYVSGSFLGGAAGLNIYNRIKKQLISDGIEDGLKNCRGDKECEREVLMYYKELSEKPSFKRWLIDNILSITSLTGGALTGGNLGHSAGTIAALIKAKYNYTKNIRNK